MPVQLSAPRSIWSLGAALLEGPVWVDGALWFVDIKGKAIHHLHATGARESWPAPAQVGFILPAYDGAFVAGLQTGLARFDPANGHFTPLVDPEPGRPGNRLNDATVDPAGRLWFGTMDDDESAATGRIYRLQSGQCIPETAAVAITNGPAVSPDGRTLYHVDTLGRIIHAATIGATGALSDPRIFACISHGEGNPDGPTVDAEGCVWVGMYNGWSARRYSPAGELLESVRFPVGAITKIAFGGPDLTTVYATTARKDVSAGELPAQPEAGDLFQFETAVPGLPTRRIRLD